VQDFLKAQDFLKVQDFLTMQDLLRGLHVDRGSFRHAAGAIRTASRRRRQVQPVAIVLYRGAGPTFPDSLMKARVTVTLKTGVLDPQGKAIEGALKSLGVEGVESVRQGKVFDIEIASRDRAQAEATLKSACDKLLANTVIENYRVEVTS
jgi:phosphoribosylformylglycinamidine synthase subunit PurS